MRGKKMGPTLSSYQFLSSIFSMVVLAYSSAEGTGARPVRTYPPMTFPRANDGTFGPGCLSWDCVSFTSCYWLQYVANKTNATSLKEAQGTVISALDSVSEANWTSFLLPPYVMEQLKANITESACDLDIQSYPLLPYHDWKEEEDGPNAAPLNHKILAETDVLRVANVYGYPGETEAMHSHKWMSIFLQWGEESDRQVQALEDLRHYVTSMERRSDDVGAGRSQEPGASARRLSSNGASAGAVLQRPTTRTLCPTTMALGMATSCASC